MAAMPYADPERQRQYYLERQERRKTDPTYIAARNARHRELYADPEYREQHQTYQREYKRRRREIEPGYGANPDATNANRRFRGIIWTPEQEIEFNALPGCEVCGTPRSVKPLAMDHCHDCRHYRGGLCGTCNHQEGVLRKWQAVCPLGSPMRAYLDRHSCDVKGA